MKLTPEIEDMVRDSDIAEVRDKAADLASMTSADVDIWGLFFVSEIQIIILK